VFGRLLKSLPEPTSGQGTGAAEVFLENGLVLKAKKVEQDGQRYILQLESGGTYAPAKEDVLK